VGEPPTRTPEEALDRGASRQFSRNAFHSYKIQTSRDHVEQAKSRGEALRRAASIRLFRTCLEEASATGTRNGNDPAGGSTKGEPSVPTSSILLNAMREGVQ